jgi:hypothetical protein
MQKHKVQSLASDENMQDEHFNQSNETVIQLYHSYKTKIKGVNKYGSP